MSRGSTTSSCWPGVSNDVYPLYELMEQGGGASSCSVPCWDLFTLLLRIMYEVWPNALDWRAAPSRAAGVFTVQCMTRSRIRTGQDQSQGTRARPAPCPTVVRILALHCYSNSTVLNSILYCAQYSTYCTVL